MNIARSSRLWSFKSYIPNEDATSWKSSERRCSGVVLRAAKKSSWDEDSEDKVDGQDRRRRSEVMYRYFNNLSLCREDVGRCPGLDELKFIPRDLAMRTGYEGMNIRKYVQSNILSPSKNALTRYEPICWSHARRENISTELRQSFERCRRQ